MHKRHWLLLVILFNFYALVIAQEKKELSTATKVTSTKYLTSTIRVNLQNKIGKVNPAWAWFGYDEPNYTYMKDGKKLLTEIAMLSPFPVHIRAHSLLVSGDGVAALKWGSTNAYTEDSLGNPIYNWRIIDSIFDTYVQRGLKPLAQIGFMPEALSSKPQPYQHHWKPGMPYNEIYTGWTYPPKDYRKWAELVFQWVKHSIDRYGQKEVDTWFWELWNEPDSPYWGGTLEEYEKLYDYTVDAAKRASPNIKIGGPHVTGPAGARGANFLKGFLNHCDSGINYVTGKRGTSIDFIAFHAKGSPRAIKGQVRMDMGKQLRDINSGFKIVASYEKYKNLPIIIGESDPEGCAACGMATNPENAYRNGTMYSSYTAASFARKFELADKWNVQFLGAVSWSFEFENQPWFYGFRDLATNGVDKPVLNVFRMFGMMQGDRIKVEAPHMYSLNKVLDSSVRNEQADIGAVASMNQKTASLMAWNYRDDDVLDTATKVSVSIHQIPAAHIVFSEYRIDQLHSNSYEVWKKMGSPQQPTKAQIDLLEKSGHLALATKPQKISIKEGVFHKEIILPSQGVVLLKIDWK